MAEFKKDDILLNPERKTAMWRVLEVDGNRIRIVRSSKSGEIHSMARDKSGQWKNASDLKGFQVINRYSPGQPAAPAPKTTAKAGGQGARQPRAQRNQGQGIGGGRITARVPEQTGGADMASFLRSQIAFHEGTVNSLRQQLRELTGARR